MKGTEAFIETLLKHGTKITFGYPGGSVIPLFDAFLEYEGKIRNLLVRHEQGAAHAADAFGRVLGRPGVCIATSGPGASNLVTGIMTAYMDSSPMIAVGGQVKANLLGNDAFQEMDMMGVTIPITKHSFQPKSPDDIAPVLMKAYRIAVEGRPGPVYIDIPSDVQSGHLAKPMPKDVAIESFRPNVRPHPNQIRRAAEMILAAERPLFLAGGGVITANASKELAELVDVVKAPVATTLMGKGAFDENNPLSLGMIGMHGRKIANYAAINCDLLIVIGCRLNDRVTGNLKTFAENCKVIHMDIDPAEIGKNVKIDLPIVADSKLAMAGLTKAIAAMAKKKPDTEWEKRMKELREMCLCSLERDVLPVSPIRVVGELMKAMKAEDIVCTGVGQHQMFCAHFMRLSKPRTFISSGGAGTMGFGLPAAIGAKVARPEAEAFDVDGDGSFQMTVQELGTCAEEGIKVNPVIMSNHYLGMVRQWLEIYFNRRYSQVNLGKNPDFVKIAEAYGLRGAHVTRPSEIAAALKEQIKSRETFVVNIELEPESNILPMLPPAGNIKDAFGGCMKAPGKFF